MTDLLNALRERYAKPSDVVRALGLDEAILREGTKPMKEDAKDKAVKAAFKELIAQDANLKDFSDFFDMLKAANPAAPAEEADEDDDSEPDEFNPDDEAEGQEMEPNSAIPGLGAEEEKKEPVGRDTEQPGGGNMNAEVAQLLMKAAKMLMGGGEEKPAIDEDMDEAALDEEPEEKEEEKKVDLKPAMDAAVATIEKRFRAIRAAERDVRPYVGEIAMDAKSADEVYRAAAKILGIEGAETIHASALPTLIKMQPKPGAAPRKDLAMDSTSTKSYHDMFPGAARIGRV